MFRFSLMALLAFSIPVFGQISPEQAAIRLREREAAKVSATTRQSEISQSDVDAMQQEIQSLREQITALKKEIASLKPQPAAPIATPPPLPAPSLTLPHRHPVSLSPPPPWMPMAAATPAMHWAGLR